jgi:hypothetical protein
MKDEKDLSLPENNDLIPQDGPNIETNANPMVPYYMKEDDPRFTEGILGQLETSEMARVGEDLTLQRRYKHDAGGGEYFLLSDTNTGAEVNITLSQITKAKSIEELKGLLENGQ